MSLADLPASRRSPLPLRFFSFSVTHTDSPPVFFFSFSFLHTKGAPFFCYSPPSFFFFSFSLLLPLLPRSPSSSPFSASSLLFRFLPASQTPAPYQSHSHRTTASRAHSALPRANPPHTTYSTPFSLFFRFTTVNPSLIKHHTTARCPDFILLRAGIRTRATNHRCCPPCMIRPASSSSQIREPDPSTTKTRPFCPAPRHPLNNEPDQHRPPPSPPRVVLGFLLRGDVPVW